jgi:hypothetical protein
MILFRFILLFVVVSSSAFSAECTQGVTLSPQGFKVGKKPFVFKGVNVHLDIAALKVGKELQTFLAHHGSYDKDNNSYCRDPQNWGPMQCCRSVLECRTQWEANQLMRLKELKVNNIRLLLDYFGFETIEGIERPVFYVGLIDSFNASTNSFNKAWLRLDIATERNRAISHIKDAINIFGSHGMKTILLLNGRRYFVDRPDRNKMFTDFVTALSLQLKGNTSLIGFDLANELDLQTEGRYPSKLESKSLVQSWVNAIRVAANDKTSLITLGLGEPVNAVWSFDPYFLPIDFVSWHIYHPRIFNKAIPLTTDDVDQAIYHAGRGSCHNNPCPFSGVFDGANCLVKTGPLGATGARSEGGKFYFSPRNNSCSQGVLTAKGCEISSYHNGWDKPFILNKTFLYVSAKSAKCPSGYTFDGANCFLYSLPVGVDVDVRRIGWKRYFTTKRVKSECPGFRFAGRCYESEIPASWSPFILPKPHYYVSAHKCDRGMKPSIIGETGVSVDNSMSAGMGDENQQKAYLMQYSQRTLDCGLQGLQWWELGDVHWGSSDNNLGLMTYFGQDFDSQRMRPSGEWMKDRFPFSAQGPCTMPLTFLTSSYGRGDYGYEVEVLKVEGKGHFAKKTPLPRALLRWDYKSDYSDMKVFVTDENGKFTLYSPNKLFAVTATQFGYLPYNGNQVSYLDSISQSGKTIKVRLELKAGSSDELTPATTIIGSPSSTCVPIN